MCMWAVKGAMCMWAVKGEGGYVYVAMCMWAVEGALCMRPVKGGVCVWVKCWGICVGGSVHVGGEEGHVYVGVIGGAHV